MYEGITLGAVAFYHGRGKGDRFRHELLFAGHDGGRPDPYKPQPGVRNDGVGLLVGPAFRSSLLVGALGSPPAAPCGQEVRRHQAGDQYVSARRWAAGSETRLSSSPPSRGGFAPRPPRPVRSPGIRLPAGSNLIIRLASSRAVSAAMRSAGFTTSGQFLQVHWRAPDLLRLRPWTKPRTIRRAELDTSRSY